MTRAISPCVERTLPWSPSGLATTYDDVVPLQRLSTGLARLASARCAHARAAPDAGHAFVVMPLQIRRSWRTARLDLELWMWSRYASQILVRPVTREPTVPQWCVDTAHVVADVAVDLIADEMLRSLVTELRPQELVLARPA